MVCDKTLTVNYAGLEAIGPKYRVTFGFVFAVMRSLGIVALGVLGYFIRIWWMLQIIWSVPILLLISYFWYVHCRLVAVLS